MEVRIAQFRAILVLLLLVFSVQYQLQSPGATPRTVLSLGLGAGLLALTFSIFIIWSHKKKRVLPVTALAIVSIGLDATLLILPVSIYFSSPVTPTVSPLSASGSLLNQPTVFAMYLLVIASGLRFRKVAMVGILVNSSVIVCLMVIEALSSQLVDNPGVFSSLAIKQHILLLICSALLAWLISTHTRVTTQKAASAALQATTDPLTGAFNRYYLRQRLDELCRSSPKPLHLLMIDADHFKAINDNQGHLTGDRVLIELARRLQLALRPTDILARYGGEEFCVVLPDIDDVIAISIAERLRKAISDQEMEGLPVTVSVGLSRRQPDESISSLIDRADRALYKAKEEGRNRVQADWPEGDLLSKEELKSG